MNNKIIAVIPAYNEEKTIGNIIKQTQNYVNDVIVIDDGSSDKTNEIAKKSEAIVYRHFLNQGLGAALKTGIIAALKKQADIIITLDADGQHNPQDIPRIIKPILDQEVDFVIGSRITNNKMPFKRRIYNKIANLITFFFFNIRVKDSQSGFRAFTKEAAQKIDIKTRGMEISSEIVREIKKNKLRIKEIPIQSIYTEYSLSKGQNFLKGVETFFRLILYKIIKK